MTWWLFELNHDWCWPSLQKQQRLTINVTTVAQRKKPSHMQIYTSINVSYIMSETGIQLMATQVEEFFGIVPMTFKRNAALELGVWNLPKIINRFFYFKLNNDHTSDLDSTLASTRTRVLRHTIDLSPLQHLATALLCGIVTVRMGKPSWKVNKP